MTAKDLAHAFGYLYDAEVDFLQEIVKALPPGAVVVNLGAGAGTSTVSGLEIRPDLTATWTTIDMSESSPLGCLEGERTALKDRGMAIPRQILEDSLSAHRHFEAEEIDLIIVDDDHTHEHVVKEIRAWASKVNIDGLWLFHDYHAERWQSVTDAVHKFWNPDMVKQVETYGLCRESDRRDIDE